MKKFQCPKHWSIKQRLDYYTIPEALTGCHICWAAPKVLNYPGLTINGRVLLAHRLAWIVEKGPIPEGMDVCHRCDNPPCVNIDHLFLGTHAENMADRNRKGRQVSLRGEKSGSARITEEQARAIFNAVGKKTAIARRFNVTYNTVIEIKLKRSWKHIHATPAFCS